MTRRLIVLAMAAIAIAAGSRGYAQTVPVTADVPRVISYQGVLTTSNGAPIQDGSYRITVSLYADESGGDRIWQESYSTTVTGGVFALDIGGLGKALPGQEAFNRPLWVGITLDGAEEMRPLTRLTASPYALAVPDKSIGTAKLADGAVTADKVNMPYVSEIRVNGEKVAGRDGAVNIVGGKDVAVTYDRASGNVVIGKQDQLQQGSGKKESDGSSPLSIDYAWYTGGDMINISSGFLNGVVATIGANDWIGTSNASNFNMRVNGQHVMLYKPNGTNTPNIEGGHLNNSIAASSYGSIIAGGGSALSPNTIGNADSTTLYATVGGGMSNVVLGDWATVGGGLGNQAIGEESTVAGGDYNAATGAFAAIAGGHHNLASGHASFIGGGGDIEHIFPFIANVASANYSSVVGGFHDTASGAYAFTGGGRRNNSAGDWSTIAGGDTNVIAATSQHGFIGGGQRNFIADSANNHSMIGGGWANLIDANTATIAGGQANTIQSIGGAIGGGTTNLIDTNAIYSVVGGGNHNVIHKEARGGAIGGGLFNEIGRNPDGTVEESHYGVIGGGSDNFIYDGAKYAAIGGGVGNRISPAGQEATIIGGDSDTAQSYGQVVMGVWNQPKGNVPYRYNGGTSAGYNDPILIVGNGDGNTGTRSNAFEVSYNGHSTVYRNNGQGTYAVRGATYTDNVIYAWGDATMATSNGPVTQCSFGVTSIKRRGTGWYRVELDTRLPDFTTQVNWSCASVTATIGTCTEPSDSQLEPLFACHMIRTTRIGTVGGKRVFDVYISKNTNGVCEAADACFSFKLTGRASN